ncbi:MAG: hypothetical protein AAGJ91_02415 [Pseudomonadota bacterium]
MTVATRVSSLFLRPRADAAADTGGAPPRRTTGPVLMGDIHGSLGGRPLLLLLWERWQDEASHNEDE